MLLKADFCKAIAKRASQFIKFPETEEELTRNIRIFAQKSPFPQVVGAIDGSHTPLKTVPVNERIEYFNRKQDYSIVVPAVADASFKFLDVSTGFPGGCFFPRFLEK